MSTENIKKFLMPPDEGGAYTDEKLAALLAHAQDGKLAFDSCCCLVGVANAPHALFGERTAENYPIWCAPEYRHHMELKASHPIANAAEHEFAMLCSPTDKEGRERLIPLILAEMERREQKRVKYDGNILPAMTAMVTGFVDKVTNERAKLFRETTRTLLPEFVHMLKQDGDPNHAPHNCIDNLSAQLVCRVCGATYTEAQ